MTEHKSYSFRQTLYRGDRDSRSSRPDQQVRQSDHAARAAEKQGWDAYRRWLSRVGAKPTRDRSPVDHSLYSWKGYHSWADRVKQTWKPENDDS